MSILDRMADGLRAYQQELQRDRHPYLTRELQGFQQKWVLKEWGYGCRPVKAQASISMEKDPSPLPGAQPKPTPVQQPVAASAKTTALTKEGEAILRKQAASSASQKTPEAKKMEEDCPPPPPFDMLDLPEGMEAMSFKYSAYCARRWFNGKRNVIPDKFEGTVPTEFVDTETFKLNWILGFGTVRDRYEHLLATNLKSTVEENIYNDKAKVPLQEKLRSFLAQHNNYYAGTLDTLAECGNDKQVLHQRFQFQHVGVSVFDTQGDSWKTVVDGLAMNDLAASLANFSLYAAVATAKVSTAQYNRYDKSPWRQCTHTKVEITHIYIYAKDFYSFNDKTEVSQYLGHWNRQGVIIALASATADWLSKKSEPKNRFELGNAPKFDFGNDPSQYLPPLPQHLDKPVDTKSNLRKADVYYPVRNRDFHNWRELKGRGGDFAIYSNFERIKLPKPILLDLGEVCREKDHG